MRYLAAVVVGALLMYLIGFRFLRHEGAANGGAASQESALPKSVKQSIDLIRVRGSMTRIAAAEREQYTLYSE